jgi:hypothetical protein
MGLEDSGHMISLGFIRITSHSAVCADLAFRARYPILHESNCFVKFFAGEEFRVLLMANRARYKLPRHEERLARRVLRMWGGKEQQNSSNHCIFVASCLHTKTLHRNRKVGGYGEGRITFSSRLVGAGTTDGPRL